jgi:two-component system response regulator DesR
VTAGTLPANLVAHPCEELLSGAIKVLLAMDLDLVRGALISLLSRNRDIEVVAALKCDDQVVRTALRERPDVVVVDVDVSWASSLTVVRELRRSLPDCQIVAMTAAKPAGLVWRLLAAGVLGVIGKNVPAALLFEAIRGAAKRELVVDVNLAVAALTMEPNPMTPRELEVLGMAAGGASGPEIAKHLYLSAGTVRNYFSKVIKKTRARSTMDAVRIAREFDWI